VILQSETPQHYGLKTGDIITFQFFADVKERLDAERQEKEVIKRKEQIKHLLEIEREEKEIERLEKERELRLVQMEKEQEERLERCEKERVALTLFFGQNDEATVGNTDDEFDATRDEALKAFILKKRNWMNDHHYQRVMSYFVDDMFLHRNAHLLEVARYLSSYVCFIFKKKKEDYNPVKHMRILLKTFFEHDDNEKQCFSVLQMMNSEIKRLQKVYRVSNALSRFETVVERLGISQAKDVNATFGEEGISHMTLSYILDNKQMIGYLYNHGGKITTVLEFFEVNFLANNPKLNTPALRLMVLMYITIEIYEIGIRWISPVNDEDLIAEFEAMKTPSTSQELDKKKKYEKSSSSVTTTPGVSKEAETKDEDDDESDYSVFAKQPTLVGVKKKKKANAVMEKKLDAVKDVVKPVKPFYKTVEKQPPAPPVKPPTVKPPPVKQSLPVKPVTVKLPPVKVRSPRSVKLALLLQEPPPPVFLGLQYVSYDRIRYAIDRVCHLKQY
jgi:hypothetical protein